MSNELEQTNEQLIDAMIHQGTQMIRQNVHDAPHPVSGIRDVNVQRDIGKYRINLRMIQEDTGTSLIWAIGGIEMTVREVLSVLSGKETVDSLLEKNVRRIR